MRKVSKSYAYANLLSITVAYPLIQLEYNLPLRNHSAKFSLYYNQETMEITLNGKFFGHNAGCRMDVMAQFIEMEGAFLNIKIIRPPRYDEKSSLLEWSWCFNQPETPRVTNMMHQMIQNCINITYYEQKNALISCTKEMMARFQTTQRELPDGLPPELKRLVKELLGEQSVNILDRNKNIICPKSQLYLLKTDQNLQSIKLSFMLGGNTRSEFNYSTEEDNLVRFTIDYDLVKHTWELEINVSGLTANHSISGELDRWRSIAGIEAMLFNANMVSLPQFNEKNQTINWRWQFSDLTPVDNFAKTLVTSLTYFSYYRFDLYRLLSIYEDAGQDTREMVIKHVKEFFSNYPDLQPDKMEDHIPKVFWPAAIKLNLFEDPKKTEKKDFFNLLNSYYPAITQSQSQHLYDFLSGERKLELSTPKNDVVELASIDKQMRADAQKQAGVLSAVRRSFPNHVMTISQLKDKISAYDLSQDIHKALSDISLEGRDKKLRDLFAPMQTPSPNLMISYAINHLPPEERLVLVRYVFNRLDEKLLGTLEKVEADTLKQFSKQQRSEMSMGDIEDYQQLLPLLNPTFDSVPSGDHRLILKKAFDNVFPINGELTQNAALLFFAYPKELIGYLFRRYMRKREDIEGNILAEKIKTCLQAPQTENKTNELVVLLENLYRENRRYSEIKVLRHAFDVLSPEQQKQVIISLCNGPMDVAANEKLRELFRGPPMLDGNRLLEVICELPIEKSALILNHEWKIGIRKILDSFSKSSGSEPSVCLKGLSEDMLDKLAPSTMDVADIDEQLIYFRQEFRQRLLELHQSSPTPADWQEALNGIVDIFNNTTEDAFKGLNDCIKACQSPFETKVLILFEMGYNEYFGRYSAECQRYLCEQVFRRLNEYDQAMLQKIPPELKWFYKKSKPWGKIAQLFALELELLQKNHSCQSKFNQLKTTLQNLPDNMTDDSLLEHLNHPQSDLSKALFSDAIKQNLFVQSHFFKQIQQPDFAILQEFKENQSVSNSPVLK